MVSENELKLKALKTAHLVFGDKLRQKFYNNIQLIFRTRFILALIIVLLLAPQTPKDNFLLTQFIDSEFFANYGEAKHFLNWLTWITISMFLLVYLI